MDFAVDLNRDDLVAAQEVLARVVEWTKPEGRCYFIGTVSAHHELHTGCKRAFFLQLYTGGGIRTYIDAGASEGLETDLIVVSTNKRCRTYWQVDNNAYSMRLEEG